MDGGREWTWHQPKAVAPLYIATIASTGIRAGLEAKRIRLGDVRFTRQHGRQVIFIRVTKNQGKHPKPRSVVVFEGNRVIRSPALARRSYRVAAHPRCDRH